jgi:hypothetical protein
VRWRVVHRLIFCANRSHYSRSVRATPACRENTFECMRTGAPVPGGWSHVLHDFGRA